MRLFLPTITFYAISLSVVYILTLVSPNQQDGGPGFGALALIMLVLTIVVLGFVNLIKGFRFDKNRLTIALIHLIVLIVMLSTFFF